MEEILLKEMEMSYSFEQRFQGVAHLWEACFGDEALPSLTNNKILYEDVTTEMPIQKHILLLNQCIYLFIKEPRRKL